MGAPFAEQSRIVIGPVTDSINDLTTTFVSLCRDFYQTNGPIELYRPSFDSSEAQAVADVLATGWVAMGGQTVAAFEKRLAEYVGVDHAVATINATAALHLSLQCLGVGPNDLVITQANTFIAPVNAIRYVGAHPYFVDVDQDTLGMSADALAAFLSDECEQGREGVYHRASGRPIKACLPVHVLGLPCRIESIASICKTYGLCLIEDAAEALGSGLMGSSGLKQCGSFGDAGVVSFNANKLITTGSGGVLLTNDTALAEQARHLSRIAKVPHAFEAKFDEVGYNYGMPALNAAIGLAQWPKLDQIIKSKRELASRYRSAVAPFSGVKMIEPVEPAISNDWIMALMFEAAHEAQQFIEATREQGVKTRPLWQPLHDSPAYRAFQRSMLPHTERLSERVVQLPSSPILTR